jgi:hypothetical protein
MVDRESRGIKIEQLAAAQNAAIELGQKMTKEGKQVRYIRSTFVPGEAHRMCFFEAANPEVVRERNHTARIPYKRIAEAMDLTPE